MTITINGLLKDFAAFAAMVLFIAGNGYLLTHLI